MINLSLLALLLTPVALQVELNRNSPSDPRSSVKATQARIRDLEARGTEPDFLAAYQQWLFQRSYPYDSPDWDAYRQADLVASAMPPASRSGFLLRAANWEEKGPLNLDTPARIWHGPQRALSGRINGIAVHPILPTTVFVATAGGGVWKSTDAGANWTYKSLDWPMQQTNTIAVDPKQPQKVYAGTGDSRGFFRLYGRGVYRSEDGGDTWLKNNNLDGSSVAELAVHPDNGEVLAVTSGRSNFTWQLGKVYTSNDGSTFNEQAAPGEAIWQGITIAAKGRNLKRHVFAAGYTLPSGATDGAVKVWRRDADTGNWVDATPAGMVAITAANVGSAGVDISASPADSKAVYLISGSDRKIYKSTDAGATWDDITSAAAPWNDAYNWSQSSYNFHILCSYVPGGIRDVVYAAQITIAASKNGTATWTDLGKTYLPNQAVTHNDQHAAAYAPSNPNIVYFSNDGGLYRTIHNPVTGTWTPVITTMNARLNTTQFYHGSSGPEPDQYVGGTQDNASPRSYGAVSPHDALAANIGRWNNAGSGDGSFTAINPNNANDSYVAVGGGLRRSTDGWSTLTVDGNGNSVPDTANQYSIAFPNYGFDGASTWARGAIDPDGSTLFYASHALNLGRSHLFRYTGAAVTDGSRFDSVAGGAISTDGRRRFRLGANAATYNASGQLFSGVATAVVVAPSDRNTVYIGTLFGKVWMSRNARAAVTDVRFTDITRNLPARMVTDLIVDPNDPHTVYVTLGGTGDTKDYVWKNEDTPAQRGGAGNWVDIDNGLPPISHNTIALHPSFPTTRLYVGTDHGVYVTENGGTAWAEAANSLGMPRVQVNKLVFNRSTGRLDAFTFGRGVWSLALIERYQVVGFGLHSMYLKGKNAVEGRIVLDRPVAANTAIPLTASVPASLTVPATVTIPAGQNSITFNVSNKAVAAQTDSTIKAVVGGVDYFCTVRMVP